MSQSQSLRRHPGNLPEGSYIPLARRVLVAQQLKQKAHDEEIQAKRECATQMHAAHMREFAMEVEGKLYDVKLARRWVDQINVRKLYTMLSAGEITLDEFFDCIEAPVKNVSETLKEEQVNFLQESIQNGLDLLITPQGG